MVTDVIKLADLNLEELSGVVNIYPWFSAARVELCSRMSKMGDGVWDEKHYAQEALYVNDRIIVCNLAQQSEQVDFSDEQVESLLGSYFENKTKTDELRKVVVVGGDYFSQSEYEKVRKEDDNIMASFCPTKDSDSSAHINLEDEYTDFCTEALARVYIDQGFPETAKEIYSKLILRYPEKSVYFATLIEKIDNKI